MDLSILEIISRIAVGAIIGFMIGLTGIGGGVLVIPTLTLCFGLPPSVAVGTASLYAFISQIMASIRHFRLNNVDFRIYPFLMLGALPGNIAVSTAINYFLKTNADNHILIAKFQSGLNILIVSVIAVSALILIINLFKAERPRDNSGKPPFSDRVNRSFLTRLMAGLFFGSFVGALIGSTSVGTGVILIPTLITVFGLSANRTVGTSVTIGATLTLATAIVFSRGGQINLPTSLLMAVGSLVGVHPGAKLAATMPPKLLKKVMIAMVVVAGVLMLMGKGGGH